MAFTVVDLDDVMASSEAMLTEWEQEFQRSYYSPLMDAAMIETLLSLPPEIAASFAELYPEEFGRLNKQIRRMKRSMLPEGGTRNANNPIA